MRIGNGFRVWAFCQQTKESKEQHRVDSKAECEAGLQPQTISVIVHPFKKTGTTLEIPKIMHHHIDVIKIFT